MSDPNLAFHRDRPEHPKGWTPGYEWDGSKGTLTTRALDGEPSDWDALAAEMGVPAFLTVDEDKPVRSTNQVRYDADGATVTQVWYKVSLKAKSKVEAFDYPALARKIRSRKKPKRVPPTGDRWLVLLVADLQTGKRAGGHLAGLAERMKQVEANLVDHVGNLRRIGVEFEGIAIVGMGDIVEGCGNSHYSYQAHEVGDASRRTQIRAAKDILWSLIDTAAPLFEKCLLTAVPGNHGENRQGSKAVTNPRQDNDDLLVFEWLADKLHGVDRYEHVQCVFPEEQLSSSFDLGGTIVGFTHGHQFDRGGGLPVQKAINYLKNQSIDFSRPVRDVDVLCYAHYHHPVVMEIAEGRWVVGCPTIDGGSAYFEESAGMSSGAGMACFVTGGGVSFDHWRVL